jgi:hypothetical protein
LATRKISFWTFTQNKKDAYACVQWALENRKIRIIRFSLENLKIDEKIDNNTVTMHSPTPFKTIGSLK